MAFRLFGTNRLSETMIAFCRQKFWHISLWFESKGNKKMHVWKCHVYNVGHFVSGMNALIDDVLSSIESHRMINQMAVCEDKVIFCNTLQWRQISVNTFQCTCFLIVCLAVYSGWHQWKHQRSASLALCEGNHRSPVDFPGKGQWCGALMFSLICVWYKRLRKQSWGWWFET